MKSYIPKFYDYAEIYALYTSGMKPGDIAKKIGCSKATVTRVIKKVKSEK